MEENPDAALALFKVRPPAASRITRRAVDATIRTARSEGRIPTVDCIEAALLRLMADELDNLRADTSTKSVYAKAQAWRELRETLAAFGLTDASTAGAGAGWFLALRSEMGGGGEAGQLDT